jgi:hypothetical protein
VELLRRLTSLANEKEADRPPLSAPADQNVTHRQSSIAFLPPRRQAPNQCRDQRNDHQNPHCIAQNQRRPRRAFSPPRPPVHLSVDATKRCARHSNRWYLPCVRTRAGTRISAGREASGFRSTLKQADFRRGLDGANTPLARSKAVRKRVSVVEVIGVVTRASFQSKGCDRPHRENR